MSLHSLLAPPDAPIAAPNTDGGISPSCSVFVVSKVVNASGGRTGCFLFRGSLVTPPPRASTPLPGGSAAGLSAQRDALSAGFCDAVEEEQVDFAEYEGQELTLYMSYEEASPKIKQRGASASAISPWRAILRDQQDELVYCLRGMPPRLHLDAHLRLACWGPAIAVRFPTTEDAQAFASRLERVEVEAHCLAGSPQCALLAARAVEQALAREPAPKAATSSAGPAASSACPPSPALDADVPRCAAGTKRKAEAPTALLTPVMKPRIKSMLTPTCSCDLGPQ